VLFDDAALACTAGRLDAKTVWLLGRDRSDRFDELRAHGAPLPLPQMFEDGGYAVLGASPGGADEVRIVFDVGRLGYLGIAAHGHADALSVLLSAGGQPLLVDPGTYSYHGPLAWREHFRSTGAHNTVEVDGRSQSVSGGRFMWVAHADARCTAYAVDGPLQRCTGRIDRQPGAAGALAHQRSLEYHAGERRLQVVDELEGIGEHAVALHWQVAHGVQVRPVEGGVQLQAPGCRVLVEPPAGWQAEVISAREGNPLAWVSDRYDIRAPGHVVRMSRTTALPVRLETRLSVDFLPPTTLDQGASDLPSTPR
jgi:hypothetical protein